MEVRAHDRDPSAMPDTNIHPAVFLLDQLVVFSSSPSKPLKILSNPKKQEAKTEGVTEREE